MGRVTDEQQRPAWKRPTRGEARWPVALAILVAVGLQWATPTDLAFDPRWLLPAVELALLAALVVTNPFRLDRESSILRMLSLVLVGWPR
jgi:hypothetical protein